MSERRGILGIETSHSPGSVAIVHDDTIHASVFPEGLVHGRELFPHLDDLVAEIGMQREEIGIVAVSAGPGSFTGIRIGCSAAKALGWALGIPTIAVSTLEVIAQNVSIDGELAVLLDARRGACYAARFRREGDVVIRLGEDRCLPPAELFAALPPETRLVGEGVATIDGAGAFQRCEPEWNVPRAAHLCGLARAAWRDIESGRREPPPEFDDPHALVPSYLRLSEAEERFASPPS